MARKLVIVESPSKARTIEKYLKGMDDTYTVRSSVGHVRDIPKSNKDAVDIKAGFVPHYVVDPRKKKVIDELVSLAKKSDEIILATDPDREGEAIAWHIKELLKENLPKTKKKASPIKRVAFHEITKDAIKEALAEPRDIDENLRKAQEARRVLDRLFGYDLSGLIWKKVRYGLSAGRVQSPALRILMERERQIRAFIPETFFVITGSFTKDAYSFDLVCEDEPKTKKEADTIVKKGQKGTWAVASLKETPKTKNPKAPFTTSTLQQSASTRLGFSPSGTMRAAQELYEKGHITYMRTDSPTLSQKAHTDISSVITKSYGKKYDTPRQYASKSKSAQEAHEAIRPTEVKNEKAGTGDASRLYTLIRERTIASQMAPAEIIQTKLSATLTGEKDFPHFATTAARIVFPGWMRADSLARTESTEVPKLNEGDTITCADIASDEKQTQPPSRYSEAGLVKELEKRGIGRPSTYASIIQTLLDRGYALKEGRTLHPTDTGDVVSSFLEENFTTYINDEFTAEMENNLDDIATGDKEYVKTLKDFYTPFTKHLREKEDIPKLTTLGKADTKFTCPVCKASMDIKLGRTGKFLSCSRFPDCDGALTMEGKEVGKAEPLGTDPKTKLPVYLLEGRFGPYVQLGETPTKPTKKSGAKKKAQKEKSKDEKEQPKPRRASLPAGMESEDVTLKDALHLLKLPRELGTHPDSGEPVIANIGRFGPYVGAQREFRSIKKTSGLSPYTITLKEALDLLAQPKALPKGTELVATVGKHPKTGKEIQILKSKSGMFVRKGLQRIYLPDDFNAEKATIDDILPYLQ